MNRDRQRLPIPRTRMRLATLAAGAAMLALAAAACGGSSGSSRPAGGSTSGSGSSSGGSASVTNVKLGYVPYADDAALFLAQQDGIFRKHGLNVSFVPQATPVAIASSMQSGQEQFGFITTPVLINLNSKGIPVKCVSSVDGAQPTNPADDGTVLVAAKNSSITSIKDLAGKNIGIVQLTSLNSLATDVLAKRAGINPASVHQITMPFPQMPAALSQGRIQAAIIVSPFANTAIAEGARVIDHPNAVLFPGGTVTCLDALSSYISAHPKVVEGFHAAMNEAIAYAKDHQSAAKAALATYMNLTPQAAQKQILSTDWNPALSAASIGQIETYMKEFGWISSAPPASSMIWPPAG
jgi:NitT/TauT family transport system substrate-binding protein